MGNMWETCENKTKVNERCSAIADSDIQLKYGRLKSLSKILNN